MAPIHRFCGIVLAAGASSRMGRDKALLPWPAHACAGNSFLEHHMRALRACVDTVRVVAGANAAALAPLVQANMAELVVNPQPERGQFSSLRVGLQQAVELGYDSAVVALVDRPAARRDTIETLKHALDENTWAAIPEHNGGHGHPIALRREIIIALLDAPEFATARDVLHAHHARIAYLAVDDPAVTMNLNTMKEYWRACALAE